MQSDTIQSNSIHHIQTVITHDITNITSPAMSTEPGPCINVCIDSQMTLMVFRSTSLLSYPILSSLLLQQASPYLRHVDVRAYT